MALPTTKQLMKELNSRGIYPLDFDYQFLPNADPKTTAKQVVDEIIEAIGKQQPDE
jgi:hypothetical protein